MRQVWLAGDHRQWQDGTDEVYELPQRTRVSASAWRWPTLYLTVMVIIAAVAGRWGGRRGLRCEMDGQQLVPTLRADLQMPDGSWHSFCSIQCARRWLAQRPATPKQAIVRDELSGEPIDSYTAFFVRSDLVTNRSNGNNIHAFRYRTDAAEHIRRFNGAEIDDPFQVE